MSHLVEVDLEIQRHFVGLWATDAHVLAGSDVPGLYDIGKILGEDADHYVLTLDRVTLSVAKYAGLGGAGAWVGKTGPLSFPLTIVGPVRLALNKLARQRSCFTAATIKRAGCWMTQQLLYTWLERV